MTDEETIKDIITWQIEFARRDGCTNADAANRIIVELERRSYMILPKKLVTDLIRAERGGDLLQVLAAYRAVRREAMDKAAGHG